MTDAAAGLVLEEFGTGFETTRITLLPDNKVHWHHRVGSHRSALYPSVPGDFLRHAQAASSRALHFSTPVAENPRELGWVVNGRQSIGGLLEPGEHPDDARLRAIARHLGTGLRKLHDRSADAALDHYPLPPGPSRLKAWLKDGRGPRAATGFHYRLRSQLGPARWDRLRAYVHHLLHPKAGEPRTILHGWFSLGAVVVPDAPGGTEGTCVLTGPDVSQGRPETDLACLIGELTEFRFGAARLGLDLPLLDSLQSELVTHYGGAIDRGALAIGATVRIATHAHDFAAYVGWGDQLHGYIPMLAELIDCDGDLALTTA
ncbi:hypothetical protein JQK87_04655 [Streptomyces sp. G44]|uniref:hypothetical protein n=1 Tax=Streptomyces sp. G44 TaxID=2807632 RepID=UPI001960BA97|nr:hypothetical protein [Streptomyces sp. G44]MBM7167708.1 hypothetical protein [Streptomyces sp. G44]